MLLRSAILFGMLAALPARAQEYYEAAKRDSVVMAQPALPQTTVGIGIGLDYGGFGGQLDYAPHKNIVVIAGLGFALVGPGWNLGVEGRLVPGGRGRPFFAAIYGYNAVIKVEGASQYDKLYYGPSFGAGVELQSRRSFNHWRFVLWIPVRPQEYRDDMNDLKNNPLIEIRSEPPDFAIGIGYHFAN